MGSEDAVSRAPECFWKRLEEVVSPKYTFQAVQFVDKLTNACLAAVGVDKVHIMPGENNLITRTEVEQIDAALQDYKGNSGFFFEYRLKDIRELMPVSNTKLQTIVLLGEKEMRLPLLQFGCRGIDRITGIGHTMDFDFMWDGYDLTERLTRGVMYQGWFHQTPTLQ